MPQSQGDFQKQAASTAAIGQGSAPYLTVQCGKFTAPVQREGRHMPQELLQQNMGSMGSWTQNRHSFEDPRSTKVRLCIPPIPARNCKAWQRVHKRTLVLLQTTG